MITVSMGLPEEPTMDNSIVMCVPPEYRLNMVLRKRTMILSMCDMGEFVTLMDRLKMMGIANMIRWVNAGEK